MASLKSQRRNGCCSWFLWEWSLRKFMVCISRCHNNSNNMMLGPIQTSHSPKNTVSFYPMIPYMLWIESRCMFITILASTVLIDIPPIFLLRRVFILKYPKSIICCCNWMQEIPIRSAFIHTFYQSFLELVVNFQSWNNKGLWKCPHLPIFVVAMLKNPISPPLYISIGENFILRRFYQV